ncbi:uncharacterized protein LOC134107072 isoform X2 [Pungitius pungitius]|uniref:uncharacterized protein LOC134107072 isoform X2 n=1 Tax=Pungitius pungitius TaxID=134920 RepID=UPI002E12DB58
MDPQEQSKRAEDRLKHAESFRRTAYELIFKMNKLNKLINEAPGETTHLLDEMLHSIFFLGKVNKPPFSPESILMDDEMLGDLRKKFPRAFELFSSHLPRRSPFSCVLDMIVHLNGPKNEREILRALRSLIIDLNLGYSRDLISSTICVSHRTDIEDPDKFYGVSMAVPGRSPRQRIISASCLYYWDECVAGAVLTYYPDNKMKPDYDGTIQLPQGVRCQAFSLSKEEETPPCKLCSDLFGLTSDSEEGKLYGNCAEAESLSKLFKNDPEIKKQVQLKSGNNLDGRVKYEKKTRKRLFDFLIERDCDCAFYPFRKMKAEDRIDE